MSDGSARVSTRIFWVGVVGLEMDGQARAYPLQCIGYHHQVRDTLAGQPILVSYCTVCRTGRVFRPAVNGSPETFRLVGMDLFNAMFEDRTSRRLRREVTRLRQEQAFVKKVATEFPRSEQDHNNSHHARYLCRG